MQNIVRVLLIATCFVWAPRSIAAAGVAWDTDRAVLAGSGCAKDVDSFVASTESDLSIVLTGFVLDLNGFSGQVLAARKTCLLRIPARIPTGYYVSKLTQKINYQIEAHPMV